MKLFWICAASLFVSVCCGDDFQITSLGPEGSLTFANSFTNGVVTIEKATSLIGPWLSEKNVFSTDIVAQASVPLSSDAAFFRALAVDLSGPQGFTNLVESYGTLSAVAGSGGTIATPSNNWRPEFEGGPATNAELSHPHIAMADRAGNIFIADKEAHAIRKVTPDGNIHTVAGTGVAARGNTNPFPATVVALNNPNGLWVREDGTFYILDRDNGFIRKVDTNGTATALVDNQAPIQDGRGLWVSADESLVFFANGSEIRRWDTTNALSSFATGFSQLANFAMDPNGCLVVTDRARNQVYRMASDGSRTLIAGNGTFAGGGDGSLAIETGLKEVRAVWFLPAGAYFLGTDGGSQVWYVDTDGYIHLFLNGGDFHLDHSGDGAWFYDDPTALKVSTVRQITMNYEGDLIITENDQGFVRKVRFLRHGPAAP